MKLLQTQKTDEILSYLRLNERVNLNIIGKIENNSELPIYTDNPKAPLGVLVKAGYMHFLYTESDAFIEAVLSQHMSEGFFGFAGLDQKLAAKIKETQIVMWSNPCTIYAYLKDQVEDLTGEYDLRPIAYEDAETVDKYYEYRGAHSIHEIRNDIKDRPSSAVYINNEPVCWVLVHEDNSMGIMYTKEEHRRKGLAEVVSKDLTRRIIEKGQTPYLQIVDGNSKSHGLAKKCGFEEVGACEWFGIIRGEPKEIQEMALQAVKAFKDVYGIELFEKTTSLKAAYFAMFWHKGNAKSLYTVRQLSLEESADAFMTLLNQPLIKEVKEEMDMWVVEKSGKLVGAALMQTPEDDESDYIIQAISLKEGVDVSELGTALIEGFKNKGKYFIYGVVDEKSEEILMQMNFATGSTFNL